MLECVVIHTHINHIIQREAPRCSFYNTAIKVILVIGCWLSSRYHISHFLSTLHG